MRTVSWLRWSSSAICVGGVSAFEEAKHFNLARRQTRVRRRRRRGVFFDVHDLAEDADDVVVARQRKALTSTVIRSPSPSRATALLSDPSGGPVRLR